MADSSNNMERLLTDAVPQQDIPPIARLISSRTGVYPPDAQWSENNAAWLNTLKERDKPVCEANIAIHNYFVEQYGPTSDVAVATEILSDLTPQLNKIASHQFEQGFTGPKSWKEVSFDNSDILSKKITKTLTDDTKRNFFEMNTSFKKGLELMRDVLIESSNPDEIYKKHSEYMKSCIEANISGQVVLYIPFESDFTNPVGSEDDKTQICEAMASVLIPLDREERIRFDSLTKSTWERLKQRGNPHQVNSGINIIVGYNVMGAGFEILESTTGEAFVLDYNNSHEHGFYLAINNIDKKKKFWNVLSNDTGNFYKVMTLLDVIHEQAHRLYPEHREFGEVPADIPAVILSLKMAESLGLNKEDVVRGILTEYVSEIVNNVSDRDWFNGYHPSQENQLYAGYLLSGVLIANAVTSSGVARMNERGELDINASPEKLAKLFDSLETIDAKFHEKDAETLKQIELAVANLETSKIVDFFRQNIKH